MATLDQSFETNNGFIYFPNNTTIYWAQQVIIGISGEIPYVSLYLKKVGSPTADLKVQLEGNHALDYPYGDISNGITLSSADLTTSLAWYTFTFDSTHGYPIPSATAGDKIWIRLLFTEGTATNYICWGANSGGGYSGKNAMKYTSGEWDVGSSGDLNFKEYCASNAFTKQLTQSISANIIFSKSNSRTKLEVIRIVSSKSFSENRTLAQSIAVSPSFLSISGLHRIFSEVITAISNKISSFNRTLVQSITATSVYSDIISSFKSLTENVMVTSIGNFIGTFYKIISENFVIAGIVENVGAFYKILSETVKTGVSILFNIGKIILQSVIITPVYVFILTAYKLLNEEISIISSLKNTMSKLCSGIVVVSAQKIVSFGRTFLEVIKIGVSLILSIGNIFTEFVIVAPLKYVMNYSKTIKQCVNAVITSEKVLPARTFLQSILIGSVFSRLFVVIKNFSETISAFVSIVLLRPSRTLYESVKMTLSISKILPNRIFSEVVNIVSGCYKVTRRIFSETVNVISYCLKITGKICKDAVNVLSKCWKMTVNIYEETINIISEFRGIAGKIFKETINIFTNFLNFIGRNLIEIAVFTAGIFRSLPKIFSESINIITRISFNTLRILNEVVIASAFCSLQFMRAFIETISVVSSFVINQIYKVLIEIIQVIPQKTLSFVKELLERVLFVDNVYRLLTPRFFTETIYVVSSFTIDLISKVFNEVIHIASVSYKVISVIYSAVISVFDNLSKIFTKTNFTEVIPVSDTLQKLHGRTFNETVSVFLFRVKLVLNGILVGLWRSIGRVTSTIWRHLSRYDD